MPRELPPALLRDTEAILARYEHEPEHTRHVALLALMLYDGLTAWHGLGNRERTWLHVASLLHDTGWSQTADGSGHHKWSARIIREFPWQSLAPEEVAAVAQVARYHRKALPCPQHGGYVELPPEHRVIVSKLAALLRVADALDRTHRQIIRSVRPELTPTALVLTVECKVPCQREQEAVQKKADLLRALAERDVVTAVA
ncbi:hypothetical protein DB346_08805 [Verrucomicrobia bacterium LW23]|nr:hypothetical protein DB346_08805 [Verrucomicrobia bacterium LW23]